VPKIEIRVVGRLDWNVVTLETTPSQLLQRHKAIEKTANNKNNRIFKCLNLNDEVYFAIYAETGS
jgi:hypothetical protein